MIVSWNTTNACNRLHGGGALVLMPREKGDLVWMQRIEPC